MRDGQTVLVVAQSNDPFGPQTRRGQHRAQPHCPVAHDRDVGAWAYAGARGRVVACRHDVGERRERPDQAPIGQIDLGGDRDERPVGLGRSDRLALPAVVLPAPVTARDT